MLVGYTESVVVQGCISSTSNESTPLVSRMNGNVPHDPCQHVELARSVVRCRYFLVNIHSNCGPLALRGPPRRYKASLPLPFEVVGGGPGCLGRAGNDDQLCRGRSLASAEQ